MEAACRIRADREDRERTSQSIPGSLQFQCRFRISTTKKNGSNLADDGEVCAWPGDRRCSGVFKQRDYLRNRVEIGPTVSHDLCRGVLGIENQIAASCM